MRRFLRPDAEEATEAVSGQLARRALPVRKAHEDDNNDVEYGETAQEERDQVEKRFDLGTSSYRRRSNLIER